MRRSFSLHVGLSIFVAMTMVLSAHADDSKNEKAQAKRAQQMQRKLQQENLQLTQEKTTLDGQIKEAKDKLDETQKSADEVSRRRAKLAKDLGAVTAEKVALLSKLSDVEKKLADTTETLRRVESEKSQVAANLAQRSQSLTTCETKNEAQHRYGMEILDKYQKKGCSSAMLQSEPFTGLKQVQIENFVEDYREKFDHQKLDSPAVLQ